LNSFVIVRAARVIEGSPGDWLKPIPAAQAWRPSIPPNRRRLIGQRTVPMRAARLFTSSQACPRHAGALAARPWVRRSPGRGRVSVFPLLHRWCRDRSRRCLAVKARRAVSSPAAAGRTNPALVSL